MTKPAPTPKPHIDDVLMAFAVFHRECEANQLNFGQSRWAENHAGAVGRLRFALNKLGLADAIDWSEKK